MTLINRFLGSFLVLLSALIMQVGGVLSVRGITPNFLLVAASVLIIYYLKQDTAFPLVLSLVLLPVVSFWLFPFFSVSLLLLSALFLVGWWASQFFVWNDWINFLILILGIQIIFRILILILGLGGLDNIIPETFYSIILGGVVFGLLVKFNIYEQRRS